MKITWKINSEILSSKIDEEAILMSIEEEFYFGLDSIGSRIWELLSIKPATVNELVVLLMKEYEVNEKVCREDVQQFIDKISIKKLILLVEEST